MKRYARSNNSHIWHWCKDCTFYPVDEWEIITEIPLEGVVCHECDKASVNWNQNVADHIELEHHRFAEKWDLGS